MNIKYNIFYAFLLITVLISCSASDSSSIAAPYDQYGTPFTNMPAKKDAIIYQVNLRAFSEAGNLNGVRAKLGDIKALGANVIYLMPIYPVGVLNSAGGLGSPYSVKDFKSVSTEFGSMEDLRALVDEAHAMDMAVILDWVANHTSWDNQWITDHPDWYQQDENGNIIAPPGTGWNDVAQLNYNNADMKKAMIDAMTFWVYNANIDGFRCDAADFVPQSFWTDAVSAVRNVKNQEMLMLAEGTRANHYTSGFDYTFGFRYFDALKKIFSENKPATTLQDANAQEYLNNYNNEDRVVRYTTNHDVNLSDGTPLTLFGGINGSIATFLVAAYMKSIPMIYNGQEIGYNQQIPFFTHVPIDWSTANATVLDQYKKILAFRQASNAIKEGTLYGYSSSAVSAFTMEKESEKVFVMSNLTNGTVNYIVPSSLSNVVWKDAFTDAPMTLDSEITLMPYQYIVLKN